MGQKTPLYQQHLDAGARMVEFSGWDMPIQYQSVIEEHQAVRQHAGVFDVSHMTVIDVQGPASTEFLRYLLANDVARLDETGRALYSAMLNTDGGVIDDLIVYRMSTGYRLVVNCATREKDLAWIRQQAGDFDPKDTTINERPELAILAIHGPDAIQLVCSCLPSDVAAAVAKLGNFRGLESGTRFIARTGYTGEKGLEIILPGDEAPALWQQLLALGIKPVGLGARDTLRLEAGMNLYGHEMDESISPLAANMEQTIAWEPQSRDFIGRQAISRHRQEQLAGKMPILTGLVLETRGVLREGMTIHCHTAQGPTQGIITSGTFSPTLKHSIALARIPADAQDCQVDLRGKLTPVRRVTPNFVRFGKKVFE
ncbi:MAG: glycine cleavage system aminomethyltransferase GcvT [Pseudomonadales bacterium]|nr:glycine cleavage system aminomethyltransferase GcvT [Pseudomonadales bacterium]